MRGHDTPQPDHSVVAGKRRAAREPAAPIPAGPESVLALQRTIGNAAVGGLLGRTGAPAAPGAGLTIARMMTAADFRRRTPVTLMQKRGSSIAAVEQALAAYHRLPPDGYVARRRQLEVLRDAATAYETESTSKRHQGAVTDLVAESHTESAQVRIPAVIEELLGTIRTHLPIYQQLVAAGTQADPLTKARDLLTAQEAILQEMRAAAPGAATDLSLAGIHLSTWLLDVVNGLNPVDERQLVGDDLQRLTVIQADPTAPQITRDVLGDLLAHQGDVLFT